MKALIAATLVLALTGCERAMRNMYEQPRYDPGEASPLFENGTASRSAPADVVPRALGDLAATSSGRRGEALVAAREAAYAASAPAVTSDLLLRGRERYTINCMPCHSPLGDGDGPVVRRGFPHPPSYHERRLLAAPDRHYFDVITHGYGEMTPYADRVTPQDRWAIVAYIRALQLSQHAPLAELPAPLQAKLRALPAAAASAPLKEGR